MGTITAGTHIDRVSTILNDTANVRWTRAELLKWISDGQREIASIRPNANNKVTVVQLQAGTRQRIPTDGHVLMSVNRNMGVDGVTPGRVVRIARRENLDALNPDWHTATPQAYTENYLYDLQDQTAFFVTPPSDGTNYVEINYGKIPSEITADNQPIELMDIYSPALLAYMLFRAYSKEGETFSQMAAAYYQQFSNMIGVKDAGDTTSGANMQMLPFNPTVEGSNA